MPCQAAGRPGWPVVEAIVAISLSSATRSAGACSTRSKKASPGNGRAKASMNSQRPSAAKPSISRVTRARVAPS
jgi:hypothetical protein